MRRIALASLLILLLLADGRLTDAQGPTETPTPTSTPTATPTLTPTVDIYQYSTLQPSGQGAAVMYQITVGEAAIFTELAFIVVLMIVGLFVLMRAVK